MVLLTVADTMMFFEKEILLLERYCREIDGWESLSAACFFTPSYPF